MVSSYLQLNSPANITNAQKVDDCRIIKVTTNSAFTPRPTLRIGSHEECLHQQKAKYTTVTFSTIVAQKRWQRHKFTDGNS
jgi:hypothetical protein